MELKRNETEYKPTSNQNRNSILKMGRHGMRWSGAPGPDRRADGNEAGDGGLLSTPLFFFSADSQFIYGVKTKTNLGLETHPRATYINTC